MEEPFKDDFFSDAGFSTIYSFLTLSFTDFLMLPFEEEGLSLIYSFLILPFAD